MASLCIIICSLLFLYICETNQVYSETTGLPHHEYNRTRITELCLISAQTEHITLGVLPRVQNKLSLCFNPGKRIQPGAECVTGLYNDLLDAESTFNETSFSLLLNFIERLKKPVCFIAHNGISFDYPILRNHIDSIGKKLPDDILCADSLHAFRNLLKEKNDQQTVTIKTEQYDEAFDDTDDWNALMCDAVSKLESEYEIISEEVIKNFQKINETTPPTKINIACPEVQKRRKRNTGEDIVNANRKPRAQRRLNFNNCSTPRPSFKLSCLYERLTNKPPVDAHHAEVDVQMMMECAVKLGESFVDWVKANAISFNSIEKMDPHKICGEYKPKK